MKEQPSIDLSSRLCVVMVTYFTGDLLLSTIEAVLGEQLVGQLVLVDNGNPPAISDRLQRLAAAEERVTLVAGQGNVGFARGCNLGAEKAREKLLLLLNPDCMLAGGELGALVAEGRRLPETWLLGPRLQDEDGTEQAGSRREILTPRNLLVEGTGLYRLLPGHQRFRRFNLHQEPLPEGTSEVPVISGACMLLPTADYRRLGGMDEGFFLHVEDVDFCLRFRQAGGRVYFCPQVGLTHRKSSSETSTAAVEWHKARGFRRYFRKHFSGRASPLTLLAVDAVVMLRFLVRSALQKVRTVGR